MTRSSWNICDGIKLKFIYDSSQESKSPVEEGERSQETGRELERMGLSSKPAPAMGNGNGLVAAWRR